MEALWFTIISLMLATYVVLDGFDFGAGILHLTVAKNDAERRTVLASIGPVWDGNEVWLIASGGVLVYAFPRAYSAGFSGFYLPLMMVLWLLIMRGISIEVRNHDESPLWRSFWDGTLWLSSTLLAIVLGAALGNIIRGVPLDASGFFAGPLFTNFQPGVRPGVLDWYTVLIGVFTLNALAAHGTLYLNWKTAGPVQARSRALAGKLWIGVIVLGILATASTAAVRPDLYRALVQRPWSWPLVLAIVGSLLMITLWLRQGRELPAFLASCAFLASMLAATAAGLYPVLLASTLGRQYDLTAYNATAGGIALRIGLYWWIPAILLAIGYFVYLFRSFRGKVTADSGGHY